MFMLPFSKTFENNLNYASTPNINGEFVQSRNKGAQIDETDINVTDIKYHDKGYLHLGYIRYKHRNA